MACRNMLRSAILVEVPILLRRFNFNFNQFRTASCYQCSNKHRTIGSARQFPPTKPPLSCSYNQTTPYHDDRNPPGEAPLKAISNSEVSKTEGRNGQPINIVVGGTVAADDSTNEWLSILDQKVNSYPTVRRFIGIGTGGEDFVQAMVVAVESVIQQPIPQGHVRKRVSSGGKYVSVNIGPIHVVSREQVQAVYNAMRRDDRMKYFL